MLDSYLNLEGFLHRDLRFDPLRADESSYLLAPPGQPGEAAVMAELRDANGATLLARACEVRYPQGCHPGPEQATLGLLRVSMPRHPQGRELLLLHAGRVLHAAKIAEQPPRIDLEPLPGGEPGTLQFRCVAPESVLVFLAIDSNGRARAAEPRREGDTYSLDLAPFTGGGEYRLRVRATQGLRTAQADGPVFKAPDAVVTGRILEPRPDAELAPDRPFSLIGNLSIVQNGRPVPWDEQHARWVVDGSKEYREQCAAVDQLEPGSHTIALWYGQGSGAQKPLAQVTVKVRARSALELELAKVLESRRAAAARPPVTTHLPRAMARAPRKRGTHGGCKCHG